mgnify:CR=1 FL=1
MKNKIFEQIKKYSKIIIHRHSRPDGDALGSQIGLKEAIKATFPKKEVYIVGDMNKRYEFMGKMDIINDDVYKGALVFILDCSEKSLISDEIIFLDNYLCNKNYLISHSKIYRDEYNPHYLVIHKKYL